MKRFWNSWKNNRQQRKKEEDYRQSVDFLKSRGFHIPESKKLTDKHWIEWFFMSFLPIGIIWEKIYPSKNQDGKRPHSTFILWLVGIQIAAYTVASERYEARKDVLETRLGLVFTQISAVRGNDSNSLRYRQQILVRALKIQGKKIPIEPSFWKLWSPYLSLFYEKMENDISEEVRELLGNEIKHNSNILQNVNLQETNLQNIDLKKTNLKKANLKETNLQNADLTEANLQNADLTGANLHNAELKGTNLEDTQLFQSNLQKARLYQSKLQNANIIKANLKDTFLLQVNLENANLAEANLEDANLTAANLQDANLEGANLQDANLEGANLQHANLTRTNLENANLERANLQHANLEGAYYTEYNEQTEKFQQKLISIKTFNLALLCQTRMPNGNMNNRDCSP